MITIEQLSNFPKITSKCDISQIIVDTIKNEKFLIKNGDILCIASKLLSKAEGNFINLNTIIPSNIAKNIHKKLPRKDPRLIQVIIDQTQDPTGKKLQIENNFIGAFLPNDLFLTSGGVDKYHDNIVLTLPHNCDKIARNISVRIQQELGIKLAVIITDSDGRIDKVGATQVAVGLYGINGLRRTTFRKKNNVETICDMLAAASGLIMGQRRSGFPLVKISGYEYDFNSNAKLIDAVN